MTFGEFAFGQLDKGTTGEIVMLSNNPTANVEGCDQSFTSGLRLPSLPGMIL